MRSGLTTGTTVPLVIPTTPTEFEFQKEFKSKNTMLHRIPSVPAEMVVRYLSNDPGNIVAISEVIPEWLRYVKVESLEILSPSWFSRYYPATKKDISNIYLLPKLKKLQISMVGLRGNFLTIPKELKWSPLQELELFHVSRFPDSIGEIAGLKKLVIWQSTFSSFPKNFYNLKNLERLELRYCYQIPEQVIEGMKSLPSLKELVVILHHYRRDIDI